MKKIIFRILFTWQLMGLLTLTFNIKPVRAWTGCVYIRADGSIYPPTAPITTSDNITYTLTDNIESYGDGIIVERDNVIIDGAGYNLKWMGGTDRSGIKLSQRNNVTIKNLNIKNYNYAAIYLDSSNNSIIIKNNITNNWDGVYLSFSYNNTISENNMISNSNYGVDLGKSSNNVIKGNNMTNNGCGVGLKGSSGNSVTENNIKSNTVGLFLFESSSNIVYHNNFVDNTHQTSFPGVNVWDDGYPSGGNYWSDYQEKYPNAMEIDNSGIWDTAYVIDANNKDNYPLISPIGPITRIFTVYSFQVAIFSNSSISRFHFNETNKQLSFTVTGPNETRGFCKVVIPKNLLWGDFSLYKDGSLLEIDKDYIQTSNATHFTFYIEYNHSTHTIEIISTEAIPEFSMSILLSLLMILSAETLVFAKKKNARKLKT